MKVIGTIFLSFVVILAGLVVCISSTCAFGGGVTAHERIVFGSYALFALLFLIGAAVLIKEINQ